MRTDPLRAAAPLRPDDGPHGAEHAAHDAGGVSSPLPGNRRGAVRPGLARVDGLVPAPVVGEPTIQSIFAAVGITTSDFQIAGGLILFILAARDLVHSAAEEPTKLADDFGVVPLGMPLIAGPASITTLILLAQTLGFAISLAALAVNLGLVVLAFAYSERLVKLIGATGLRAISKIVSMLLAAIAVNMIRKGWSG